MARTLTVTAPLLAFLLAAMVVISASAAVAAAIPPRCPAGTHELGWGESPCISDSRHMAPSGSGSIPYFATGKDYRVPLRIEIAAVGLVIGGLLLVGALWGRKPVTGASVPVEVATA